jgi:hypothetical protein
MHRRISRNLDRDAARDRAPVRCLPQTIAISGHRRRASSEPRAHASEQRAPCACKRAHAIGIGAALELSRPRDAQRPDGRCWNGEAKRDEQRVEERAPHTAGRRALIVTEAVRGRVQGERDLRGTEFETPLETAGPSDANKARWPCVASRSDPVEHGAERALAAIEQRR